MSGNRRRALSIAMVGAVLMAGTVLTASAGSPGASSFVPITPCRLFDTRPGSDNVGPRATPIGAGETFTTAGRGTNGNCNVPSDATGLSMNVAIVNPSAASFLTVFPGGTTRPLAASQNWVAGQPPTPNGVNAALGADGTLSFYNLAGTVDLAVDVVGYYEPAPASGTGPQGPPGAPAPRPAQIVWVAPSGGDFTTVGAALASITDASQSKPYLIRVAPGTFAESAIDLEPFVDIEGSGDATILQCACGSATPPTTDGSSAVIRASGSSVQATVRNLNVRNTGGGAYVTGIRTVNTLVASLRFEGVSVNVLGGSASLHGLYLGGPATIDGLTTTIFGTLGAEVVGIFSLGSPILRHVSINVNGVSGTVSGIKTSGGILTLADSTVLAAANPGSGGIYGLNLLGTATVSNSLISGLGGSTGIGMRVNSGTVVLTRSTLRGNQYTTSSAPPSTVKLSFNIIEGSAVQTTGPFECHFNVSETGAALGDNVCG